MTRKDYEKVARALGMSYTGWISRNYVGITRDAGIALIFGVVEEIANVLKADNPNFDKALFEKAVAEEAIKHEQRNV